MILLASTCVGDLYPSLKWIDFLTGCIGQLHKTARDLGDLLDQVIEEHRITLTDDDKKDFIHVLLQLQKDGNDGIELTQDTLKAILMVSTNLSSSVFNPLSNQLAHTRTNHICTHKQMGTYMTNQLMFSCFKLSGHVCGRY